ncbi:DUF6086 family protein [Kitasatospora sp. NPDC004289]
MRSRSWCARCSPPRRRTRTSTRPGRPGPEPSPPERGNRRALDRHLRTGHAVIRALSEGFVLTTLVLADRAGVGPGWEPTGSGPAWELRDVQVPARPVTDGLVGELRLKVAELSLAMAR